MKTFNKTLFLLLLNLLLCSWEAWGQKTITKNSLEYIPYSTILDSTVQYGGGTKYYYTVYCSVKVSENAKTTLTNAIIYKDPNSGILVDDNYYYNYVTTKINDGAFYDCRSLSEVTGDLSAITSVGSYAFYQCDKLTSIPNFDNITSIQEACFRGCSKLETISIPQSVTSIGWDAFRDCAGIEKVNVSGNDLTSWMKISFANEYSNPLMASTKKDKGLYVKGNELTDAIIDVDSLPKYTIAPYVLAGCASLVKLILIGDNTCTIGEGAFMGCTKLAAVKRDSADSIDPTQIGKIKKNAFQQCANLMDIKLDRVTEIGEAAFMGCAGLKKITDKGTFPSSLSSNDIGNNAFRGTGLEKVVITNGKTINEGTYGKIGGLKSVSIKGVSTIKDRAFEECSSLSSVNLTNKELTDRNLSKIGNSSFFKCASLEKIVIPKGPTSGSVEVGAGAFRSCQKLDTVVMLGESGHLPTFLRLDTGHVFEKDTVVFDSPVLVLPNCSVSAAKGDKRFTSYFGDRIYNIWDKGFCYIKLNLDDAKCALVYSARYKNLETKNLELPNKAYDEYNKKEYTVDAIEDGAFKDCKWDEQMIVTCMSEEVCPRINEDANVFPSINGKKLNRLVVPYKKARVLIEKDKAWQSYFEYIVGIRMANDNLYFSILTNGSGGQKGTCEVAAAANTSVIDVKIPDTITYNGKTYNVVGIGDDAFLNCEVLKSVDVSKNQNIKTIGNNAFRNCKALKSFSIPGNVKSIGDSAFCRSGLDSIIFPNYVNTIGAGACKDCGDLKKVVIGKEVRWIGADAFLNCKLKEAHMKNPRYVSLITFVNFASNPLSCAEKIYVGDEEKKEVTKIEIKDVDSIAAYAYSGSTIKEVSIAGRVKYIGECAFKDCKNLSKVTLEEGLEEIRKEAFMGCSILSLINLPSSLVAIREGAFKNCSSLSKVEIPSQLTLIDKSTFAGCTGLNNVILHEGFREIKDSAFAGCTGLTKLNLPIGMTTIGKSICAGCTSLRSIDIPNDIEIVEDSSFWGCTQLQYLVFPNTLRRVDTSAFFGCNMLDSIVCNAVRTPSLSPNTIGGDLLIATDSIFTQTYGKAKFTMLCASEDTINAYGTQGWWIYFDRAKNVKNTDNGAVKCDTLRNPDTGEIEAAIGKSDTSGVYQYRGNMTVPDSVSMNGKKYPITKITDSAFAGTPITGVTIGPNIHSIGKDAFADCNELKTLTLENLDAWCTVDMGSAKSNPIYYTHSINLKNAARAVEELYVKKEEVKSYTFYGFSDMTRLTFGEKVAQVGDSTFWGCSGLKEVSCHMLSNIPTLKLPSQSGCVFDTATTLHIPFIIPSEGLIQDYTNGNWGAYFNISIVSGDSGREEVKSTIKVYSKGSDIIIRGAEKGDQILVSDEKGNNILKTIAQNGEDICIPISKSNFGIVKVGNTSFKVLIP